MVRVSLKPKHQRKIKISIEYAERDPKLLFEVRADHPVTTYLVDDMGLEDYGNGQTPSYYAGFKDRRNHLAELTLPGFSQYHLIIVNKSPDNPAKIEYTIKVW